MSSFKTKIKPTSCDGDVFIISNIGSLETAIDIPNFIGTTISDASMFQLEYRDIGRILTELINQDAEIIKEIEVSRKQVISKKLFKHEELFG